MGTTFVAGNYNVDISSIGMKKLKEIEFGEFRGIFTKVTIFNKIGIFR